MEAALRTRLLTVAGLAGAKVAWDERPRTGGSRAIVLTAVSPGRDYTHDGHDGLDFAWVQADVWGGDSTQVQSDAAALIAEIELAPRTVREVGGVRFQPGFIEQNRSEPPDEDSGDILFRRIVEFRFHWETL